MSDHKQSVDHVDYASRDGVQQPVQRTMTTVTLTPEQFESLYLTPRNPNIRGDLASRVGNPTPLYVWDTMLLITRKER